MTDEEILYLVRVGASLGVNKIRLTGGEPTIRPHVVELVREIARVPGMQRPGDDDQRADAGQAGRSRWRRPG